MTDDIVTRLRAWKIDGVQTIYDDAADEIERLRQDRDKWRKVADDFASTHRHRFGLDGAWDAVNIAYEKAVLDD